jgi:Peptidase family S58
MIPQGIYSSPFQRAIISRWDLRLTPPPPPSLKAFKWRGMIQLVPTVSVAGRSDLDSLFSAVADCVEEAIYNALCCAETVEGQKGRKIEAIDLEWLKKTLEKHAVFLDQ